MELVGLAMDDLVRGDKTSYQDVARPLPGDLLRRTARFALKADRPLSEREIVNGVARSYDGTGGLYDERLISDAIATLEGGSYLVPEAGSSKYLAAGDVIRADFPELDD